MAAYIFVIKQVDSVYPMFFAALNTVAGTALLFH